jgi:hypothetical protein
MISLLMMISLAGRAGQQQLHWRRQPQWLRWSDEGQPPPMARDGSLTRAGALGNFGLDWGSSSGGLYSDNGAVCWMTPDDTTGDTGEPVVVAQLTVPAGTGFTVTLNAEGCALIDLVIKNMPMSLPNL